MSFTPFVAGNESEVSPVLWIFLGSRTFPLSAIARLYRECQTPWLSQWMLWRGRRTALGISPAVGWQRRSCQRFHGHLGSHTDSLEVGSVPDGLSSGWAAPVPISFLLWPGERFLCSCHKAGDFPLCRGGWWMHFELLRNYFLIPHTAEKVCQLL